MVLLVLDSDETNKLPYNPNTFPDVGPLVERACDEFGIGGDRHHYYAIYRPAEQTFILAIEELRKAKDAETLVLRNVEQEALLVVERLERALKAHESEKKTPEVLNLMSTAKGLVTKLKHNLSVDMFGEMFIEHDGIDKLVLLIMAADGNSQAYALAALINTLFYVSAIEYLKTQPSIIASIYQLVEKDAALNTQQQTLGLLYVLAEKMPQGYHYINAAAKSAAAAVGRAPYASLVDRLGSSDVTVKVRALTLINTMLKNAPSERQLCKFMARLENLGIFEILVEGTDVSNGEFEIQRNNFQLATGIILPSLGYESEVHRARIRELSEHVAGLQKNLERYVEQQNLYQLMSDDLIRFKKLEDLSIEKETMLSCFAPLNAFSEETLQSLPMLKSGVVNLREAVKEKVYAIEKAQNQTMLVQKYADNLKKQMAKLNADMETQEAQFRAQLAEKGKDISQRDKDNQELKQQLELSAQEQSKISVQLAEISAQSQARAKELQEKGQATEQTEKKLEEAEMWLRERTEALEGAKNRLKMLEGDIEKARADIQRKDAELAAKAKAPVAVAVAAAPKPVAVPAGAAKAQVDLRDKNIGTELSKRDIEKLEKDIKDLKNRPPAPAPPSTTSALPVMGGSAIPAIPPIGGGSAIPAIGGSAIPPIGGSAIPAIGGSAIPPMGGSAIPAIGGSAIPPMGGSAIPAIGGSAIPPMGGSAIPPMGGSAIPAIGGSAIPPMGGSAIPAIGGSAIPPMGGSAIPAIGGSAIPPMGGSAIPAIGGSAIPPMGGSAIPAMGGSAIPAIGGSAIPAIPPIGGSAIPAIPPMGGSAIPAMGGSAIPSMGSAIPSIPPPGGSAIPMPPGGSAIPMPPGGSAIPMPPLPGGSSIPMPPPMGGSALPPPPGGLMPPLPPGGFGGPPPLPGMGGFGIKKVQPNKPKVVPSKKLVGLNWKRIIKEKDKKTDKPSVWEGMTQMELKLEDIEEQFAAKAAKPLGGAVGAVVAAAKPSKKKVFDGGESQKISITFKRMPASKVLRQAFFKMDETVISREICANWGKAWPEADTLAQLLEEAHEEPDAQWDFAEEYMLVLADLKNVKQKLDLWKFKMGLDEDADQFFAFFEKFKAGLKVIRESAVVRTLLQAALSLGNILNGNTDKGQADGFSIEAVMRLATVKDSTGKPAIQFITKLMKDKLGAEMDGFRKEHKAASIKPDLNEQDDMIKAFVGSFNANKKKTMALIAKINDPKDRFPEVMTEFFEKSVEKIEKVQEERKKVGDIFQEVLDYYEIPAKDSKAKNSADFFKFFNEMLDMVEKNLPKDKPVKIQRFGKKIGGGNMANLMAEMQSRLNK